MKIPPKAYFKAIAVFSHITCFVFECFIRNSFRGHDLTWTLNRRRRLVHVLLRVLKVNLHIEGEVPKGTFLFVANHRSYLDPVVMHKDLGFLPVAKSEVSKWPIIGYGAKITGVLYVKRADKESRLQTRTDMVDTMLNGHSIVIYPEGTTHIEPQTIEFRPGTFKTAATHQLPIVPIALDYGEPSDAWIGNDTFIPHLLKICAKDSIEVFMAYGEPMIDTDPENLRKKSQAWIDERLAFWNRMPERPSVLIK